MKRISVPRNQDDQRMVAVVNVRWAAGAAAEASAAERAFAALGEAARLAATSWPALYRAPALVRLLYTPADRPGAAVLAAATAAGVVASPCEAPEGEIAIVAAPGVGVVSPTLPILILGAPLRFAAIDTVRAAFEFAEPTRTEVDAAPAVIAEALFAPPRGRAERRGLAAYLGEGVRVRALRFEYELLLRLLGERAPAWSGVDDSWDRAAALNAAASVDRGGALVLLRAEYERADALGLVYGRRWRSTLAARSFLLFGTSLLSGLIGTLFPKLSVITLPVQLAVTALLYLDHRVSKRRRWRGKWIDYRRAAEATRIARFCVLADAPLLASASSSWIDWRLERLLHGAEPAPPPSEADAARFLAYFEEVEIDRQIAYHLAAFRRFRRLNARLRRAAVVTLLATIGLGGGLAVIAAIGVSSMQIPLMGAIGLALSAGPGLYASLNGLRDQFDVERQAARSARIGLALRHLRRSLAGASPSVALARAAASRAAHIMYDDVSSWDSVMEIV